MIEGAEKHVVVGNALVGALDGGPPVTSSKAIANASSL